MKRGPPRATLTDPLFPYTTFCRSHLHARCPLDRHPPVARQAPDKYRRACPGGGERRPGGAGRMMTKSKCRARSRWEVFAAPLIMGVLSLIGLVSALAGDGPADWLSWATLAVPVGALTWAMRRRRT